MKMCTAYKTDHWCKKLLLVKCGMLIVTVQNGLWFVGEHLIVPDKCGMQEYTFCLAYNSLSYFGFSKTYNLIDRSYFWPHMCTQLKKHIHGWI